MVRSATFSPLLRPQLDCHTELPCAWLYARSPAGSLCRGKTIMPEPCPLGYYVARSKSNHWHSLCASVC
eukprot:6590844-Prymnesium_polylepis.1